MTLYTREYQRLLFELQHLRWRAKQYGYSQAQVEQDLQRLGGLLTNQDQSQQSSLSQLLDNFRLAIQVELSS